MFSKKRSAAPCLKEQLKSIFAGIERMHGRAFTKACPHIGDRPINEISLLTMKEVERGEGLFGQEGKYLIGLAKRLSRPLGRHGRNSL